MPLDRASLYRSVRLRLSALVSRLGPDETTRPVPACPAWTVADVVAHVVAVSTDVAEGRVPTVPGDDWTARQVAERRRATKEALLAEWERSGPRLEALLEVRGRDLHFAVVDLWHHDQDVRNALGRPGHRQGPGLCAAARAARALDFRDLPALRFVATGLDGGDLAIPVGGHDPVGTVVVDAYELARAVVGRRSRDQIAAWEWAVDPAPYLDRFGIFPARPEPLEEPC